MSYQVLYMIPAHVSSATEETKEVCLFSPDTPEPLLQELKDNTRPRRTAWGNPSFLYRTLEAGEKMYHSMTCLRSTADGTMVHHLVFTEAETAVLRREEARPTPAGIIAALCKMRFWAMYGVPETLPRLAIEAEALPDPSVQATWKHLTGHKTNAGRLNDSPYDARCTLIMPRSADSYDVLCLLHESDWLSSACGWGVSFCTSADEADVNASLRRIACAEGGAAANAARRAGLACFTVRQEAQRLTPTRTYRPEYVYAEEEDALFYPIARKLSREARQRLTWILLATVPVAAALLFIGRTYLPPLPVLHPAVPGTPPAAPEPETVPQPLPTESEEPQHPEPTSHPAEPAVVMPGEALPETLVQAAAKGTVELTRGELRVGLLGAEGCIIRTLTEEHPAQLARNAAGYSIIYDTGDAPLHISITLTNRGTDNILLNGTPAAVDFTLPYNGQRILLIPRIADIDGGAAELKPLPAVWPPQRYIPCDKLLAPTPPSAAYPYGKLQPGRGVPALPQAGSSDKILFPLSLPDVGCTATVPEPENELPDAYRYRWKLRSRSAQLTVERDLTPAVRQSFERRMNSYCAGTAGDGDTFFSLATLYGLATLLEASDLPPAKRAAAEADYFRLYTDEAFCRLVKESILPAADHALCLTPQDAADTSPYAQKCRQELAAMLTPANCFKIREAVAQQVQPALREGYEQAVRAIPPAPHPLLQLRHVTLQHDGSLKWLFRLYPATEP